MDITTCKVFNSIHKLGLTQEDFKVLEAELKDKDKTGVYIHTVSKDMSVCVSHDEEKTRIVIQNIKGARPKSRILFKTLITFQNVPKEIFLLHRIAQYRALDTEIKYISKNLAALKERMFDRFTDKYYKELGGEYDEIYGDNTYDRGKAKKKKPQLVIDQLKALYWVFGEEYTGEDIESRLNITRIIKVWQLKNKRVALFQEKECWEVNRGGMINIRQDVDRVTYHIKTFTPANKEYNYVDVNREIGHGRNDEFQTVWLDDDLFERVQPAELEVIQKHAGHRGMWLITADDHLSMQKEIRSELWRRRRYKEEKESEEILKRNIKEQFKDGKVVRKGITITRNYFSYEGIKIKGDDMAYYITRQNIAFLETPNFNEILEGYIEFLLQIRTDTNYYPYTRTMCGMKENKKFWVGKIKISLGTDTRRMTINDYMVSKNEIEEVCKKAINYNTQKEFDEFLAEVQKVSLKFRQILDIGFFQFEVELNKNDDCELKLPEDKMKMAIPVIRENNKNYILVNKQRYSIKNLASFLNLDENNSRYAYHYESNPLQKTIVQLHKAVYKLESDDISALISEGIKNYRKMVKQEKKLEKEKTARSEEFLDHAVKITKAKTVKNGYLVRGTSGITYSINSDTLAVYKLNEKEENDYLCIVDEHSDTDNAWGKNDVVAKRLLMLSKDIKIAREIVRGAQDKHWSGLLENQEVET